MRTRLKRFTDFAESLLPLEAAFLLQVEQFDDPEKKEILHTLVQNALATAARSDFNTSYDKRKYSYVKHWITDKLKAADVDEQFTWLSQTEQRILSDSITTEEEKTLLRYFRNTEPTWYHFLKLYEIARAYRHFVQIRMRFYEYQQVARFLETHRTSYEYARLVNDKLHLATQDIMAHFTSGNKESMTWESWLSAVFYDPSLDGYNRLLAFIRIIFIAYNYRRFDLLPDKLAYLEKKIATGEFYSRRIVSNFYSQQLLYCARESMLDQAEYYGYLSIRFPNSDYLYYLNNLASVLLRNQKPQEALQVLRQAIKQARESQNPHSRIGHAAFLGMALIRTRQARQAALHCETFFKAYQQQVFEHRWHLFFCAWTEALLELEQYPKIFRLKEQWDLEAKDTQYRKQHHYLPVLPMLWGMAAYFQQHLTLAQLQESLTQEMNKLRARKDQAPMSGWQNIVRTMEQKIPELKPWFASNDLC